MNAIKTKFVIVLVTFLSCNTIPKTDIKEEVGRLNELLVKFEEPSQFYRISADSISELTGKKGTVITINPSDLITESELEIVDSIDIELKELTDQNQMFRTNAQTVSNGRLLVSGGAYFIGIRCRGQRVYLKPGKTMKVEFPILTADKMSLFKGTRDSFGQLNWDSVPKTFEKKIFNSEIEYAYVYELRDSIYYYDDVKRNVNSQEAEQESKLYKEIELMNLGWINCDRFLEIENKTDLTVSFASPEKVSTANVFLIFKDINSVMQVYFIDQNEPNKYSVFKDIPIGSNVRLVAYTLIDSKIFSYSSDLVIKKNELRSISMKETSEIEFKKLINY